MCPSSPDVAADRRRHAGRRPGVSPGDLSRLPSSVRARFIAVDDAARPARRFGPMAFTVFCSPSRQRGDGPRREEPASAAISHYLAGNGVGPDDPYLRFLEIVRIPCITR